LLARPKVQCKYSKSELRFTTERARCVNVNSHTPPVKDFSPSRTLQLGFIKVDRPRQSLIH
ncbi:MAG: hypothetical protein WBL95_00005, partial [Microcoleus sp.]